MVVSAAVLLRLLLRDGEVRGNHPSDVVLPRRCVVRVDQRGSPSASPGSPLWTAASDSHQGNPAMVWLATALPSEKHTVHWVPSHQLNPAMVWLATALPTDKHTVQLNPATAWVVMAIFSVVTWA